MDDKENNGWPLTLGSKYLDSYSCGPQPMIQLFSMAGGYHKNPESYNLEPTCQTLGTTYFLMNRRDRRIESKGFWDQLSKLSVTGDTRNSKMISEFLASNQKCLERDPKRNHKSLEDFFSFICSGYWKLLLSRYRWIMKKSIFQALGFYVSTCRWTSVTTRYVQKERPEGTKRISDDPPWG